MTKDLAETFLSMYGERRSEGAMKLDMDAFQGFVDDTYKLLLLDYIAPGVSPEKARALAHRVEDEFAVILSRAEIGNAEAKLLAFTSELPRARELILGSAQAIMEGDPASDSIQEIIFCYPGFRAIALYRIANIMYRNGMKVMARMVSERAHRETGIDINPGATIGERFFIDHGTGIVIGETTIIGNDVKIYQGVTLGALSLRGGRSKLRGVKRHPTIEDGVTIYSGCAVFGGDTTIGAGSTLGAVTTVTSSIPPRSLVLQTPEGMVIKSKDSRHD